MNHKPSGLSVSKALEGFVQYKHAEGLSPGTIYDYERILKQWLERQPDVDVGSISVEDIRSYLNYMRDDYVPNRITGHNDRKLSSKSIRNIFITFKAFFHWLADEFGIDNPMAKVPAPKYQEPVIDPFTQQEVEALLKACNYKEEAKTTSRRSFTMRRPNARRDRACILVLVGIRLRASELCALKIGNVDLKTGKVNINHGKEGGAKSGKGRIVFLGKTARKALWRYLSEREDGEDPNAPLFLIHLEETAGVGCSEVKSGLNEDRKPSLDSRTYLQMDPNVERRLQYSSTAQYAHQQRRRYPTGPWIEEQSGWLSNLPAALE